MIKLVGDEDVYYLIKSGTPGYTLVLHENDTEVGAFLEKGTPEEVCERFNRIALTHNAGPIWDVEP
jgi:hypothetical protein